MDKERLRARPTSLGQRMLPRRRINEHAHSSIPTVIDGLAFWHGLVGVMRVFPFELAPAGVGRAGRQTSAGLLRFARPQSALGSLPSVALFSAGAKGVFPVSVSLGIRACLATVTRRTGGRGRAALVTSGRARSKARRCRWRCPKNNTKPSAQRSQTGKKPCSVCKR
jgi:hypothetical protein